jgi:hypothetical protein
MAAEHRRPGGRGVYAGASAMMSAGADSRLLAGVTLKQLDSADVLFV